MKLVLKNINDIHPYDNNPRNNASSVEYVANSIREFGFKQPIVIDGSGTIVAGDTRYKAALELGLKEVPCVLADDLTDEEVKEYRIADNKTAEIATWDYLSLANEIEKSEANFTDYGFTAGEISNLLEFVQEISEPMSNVLADDYGDLSVGSSNVSLFVGTNKEDAESGEKEHVSDEENGTENVSDSGKKSVYKTEMVMCPYCGEEFELE